MMLTLRITDECYVRSTWFRDGPLCSEHGPTVNYTTVWSSCSTGGNEIPASNYPSHHHSFTGAYGE